MEKHYIIKQDIINFLGNHDDTLNLGAPLNKKEVHFNKIQTALSQYSKPELLDYLDELYHSGYIYCSMQMDNSTFFIKGKGRSAYRQNQFIVDGRKEELENKKLKIDYKISKRIAGSYGATQFIAWVSLIFSAIGLFLLIASALNIWPYHK